MRRRRAGHNLECNALKTIQQALYGSLSLCNLANLSCAGRSQSPATGPTEFFLSLRCDRLHSMLLSLCKNFRLQSAYLARDARVIGLVRRRRHRAALARDASRARKPPEPRPLFSTILSWRASSVPPNADLRDMSMTQNKMQYVRLGNSGLKVSKIILCVWKQGSRPRPVQLGPAVRSPWAVPGSSAGLTMVLDDL